MPSTSLTRQALIPATINAAINGLLTSYSLRAETQLSLTMDSISGGSNTIFGNAVAGAFFMGFIITGVTFLTFRSSARKNGITLTPGLRFWPDYALLMLKNAILAFGVLMIVSVLFHRFFGVIEVSRITAAAVTAVIAFSVTWYAGISTMREMAGGKMH